MTTIVFCARTNRRNRLRWWSIGLAGLTAEWRMSWWYYGSHLVFLLSSFIETENIPFGLSRRFYNFVLVPLFTINGLNVKYILLGSSLFWGLEKPIYSKCWFQCWGYRKLTGVFFKKEKKIIQRCINGSGKIDL